MTEPTLQREPPASVNGSPKQPIGTPDSVLPSAKQNIDAPSGNPKRLKESETPENPNPENRNPKHGNPAATEPGQPMAVADKPEALKYKWVEGGEHVYSLHIMSGVDEAKKTIDGQCTYKVKDNGFEYDGEVEASGTGFVIAANGYIATCAHVVAGARVIDVTIGGKTHRATVVVQNEQLDLAILKIRASNLPVLPFGNSDRVQLAEKVRAFGFPLSDILGTGIKSASGEVSGIFTHSKYGQQIQTDAPINPGNSGGPIVNDAGQVIGIASSGIAAHFASSIGFAVPINQLKKLIIEQGLTVPPEGGGQKIAGPMLAERVTPTVALINVKEVPGGRVFEVRFSASYEETTAFAGRLPPGFDLHSLVRNELDSGTVMVNTLGEIVEMQAKNKLPFLLGSIGGLFLHPLDPVGNRRWSTEKERIAFLRPPKTNRSSQNPAAEGTAMPMTANGRADYEMTEINGDRVTIRKNHQISVQAEGRQPHLTVKGVGTLVFDRKIGMPAKMTYRGTITMLSGDETTNVPLNVSYELIDPGEVKRQREERARRIRKRRLTKFLEIDLDPEKREEVIETAKQYLDDEFDPIAVTAAEVYARWATKEHVEVLKKLAVKREIPYQKSKELAIKRLIELDQLDFFPAIIKEMNDRGFSNQLEKILIAAGPKMEDSILNCLSILNDDSDRYGIRDDLLKILGEIGTQKSSKVIEDIEFNFILERSAKRTLEQIRKRQLKQ